MKPVCQCYRRLGSLKQCLRRRNSLQTLVYKEFSASTNSPEDHSSDRLVSFQRFIPLHVGFLNPTTAPSYLENVYTNKTSTTDSKLGENLKNVLDTFIKTGRDIAAANVVRNIICTESSLLDTETVDKIKEMLLSFLQSGFQDNSLDYMDILIYFIHSEEQFEADKNTLIFQMFKNTLNKSLSKSSTLLHREKLNDKLLETSKNLSYYANPDPLLNLFHFEVAKTILKRGQLELIHSVDFSCLSDENAAKIVTKLVVSKCHSQAIEIIRMRDLSIETHVLHGLYKRITDTRADGSLKVPEQQLINFEEWLDDKGYQDILESVGGPKVYKADSKSWNELENI